MAPIWRIPLTSWGHFIEGEIAGGGHLPLWPVLASGALIVAGAVDAVCMLIPDHVTLPGIIAGLSLAALDGEMWTAFLGGIVGFVFFLVLFVLRPGALGFGDVKLMAFVGVATRIEGLPVALCAGVLLGGVYGIALLAGRLARRQDPVPYGPSLALGGIIGLWCMTAGIVG